MNNSTVNIFNHSSSSIRSDKVIMYTQKRIQFMLNGDEERLKMST